MTNENEFFIDGNYPEELMISVCGEIERKIPSDEDSGHFESITF